MEATWFFICDMWDGIDCKQPAQRINTMVRDLTDAMYDPRQPPYVIHARGTELTIEHVERYWCPSIVGRDLTTVVAGSDEPEKASGR